MSCGLELRDDGSPATETQLSVVLVEGVAQPAGRGFPALDAGILAGGELGREAPGESGTDAEIGSGRPNGESAAASGVQGPGTRRGRR